MKTSLIQPHDHRPMTHARRLLICCLFLWTWADPTLQAASVDPTFIPPSHDREIQWVSALPNGGLMISGPFTKLNGREQKYLARLHEDGTVDTTFVPAIDLGPDPNGEEGFLVNTAHYADGRMLVYGMISGIGGVPRRGIARLHADGSLDNTFQANFEGGHIADDNIYDVLIQSDEKVVLVGTFRRFAGRPVGSIVRLNHNGTIDPTFAVGYGASGRESWTRLICLEPLPDGKIIVGGSFERFNGVARPSLARLNSDGSLDLTFSPQLTFRSAQGFACARADSFGRLYLRTIGNLRSIEGLPRYQFARLKADGTLDREYNSPTSEPSYFTNEILPLDDGKALMLIETATNDSMLRLNKDGTVGDTFPTIDGIWTAAVAPGSRCYIAGPFSQIEGIERSGFARFNLDPLPQLQLSIERKAENFQLTAAGTPHSTWALEFRELWSSTESWRPLTNFTLGSLPFVVEQPKESATRFYRGVSTTP